MEIKKGQTVFVKKENENLQNTPVSGKVHEVGKNHVILRTVGGTGYYKAHKDNISHAKEDSWMHKQYQKEDAGAAPTNNAGAGNVQGIGTGPKGEPGVTPSAMNRYKKKNQAEIPAGRKTFSTFMKGK